MKTTSRAALRAGMAMLAASVALPALAANTAALQASPVLIEMTDKAPSAVVTVRNTGAAPIDVQTRVMRWTQSGGQESLEEASDVVASPPMIRVTPGANYAVRVVRSGRGAVQGEQAYRVFVDQLPDPEAQRNGTVALVMRHSIPVFIGNGGAGQPQVQFTLGSRNGKLTLRATNSGTRRLRLSAVSLTLGNGKKVSFGNGLLGYVLAGATMEWPSTVPAAGGSATLNATTDLGPLTAEAHAGR